MPLPTTFGHARPHAAVLLVVGALLAALCCGLPSAHANPAGPDDPIGQVWATATTATGAVRFYGWGADPDNRTANVEILGMVDGHIIKGMYTNAARPAMTQTYHLGPTPGFTIDVPVPATGVHVVCAAVLNIGAGVSRLLYCLTAPHGSTLTPAQVATHSPRGAVSYVGASATALRIAGWVLEPDFVARRVQVVLYVDGISVLTTYTHTSSAAQEAAGAGPQGAFDITVPVSSGAHLACIWFVDLTYGSNDSPGCRAVDTRGAAATTAVIEPALNKAVVTEALKHIGQHYVWGAAGPKTFDCSGLVTYSYAKSGRTAVPHQSGLQFTLARLIPASRAAPGDLVFYHDGVGSVYHVGIYLSPGDTVAASDESHGVAHQPIWDPSIVTYGSLTHT